MEELRGGKLNWREKTWAWGTENLTLMGLLTQDVAAECSMIDPKVKRAPEQKRGPLPVLTFALFPWPLILLLSPTSSQKCLLCSSQQKLSFLLQSTKGKLFTGAVKLGGRSGSWIVLALFSTLLRVYTHLLSHGSVHPPILLLDTDNWLTFFTSAQGLARGHHCHPGDLTSWVDRINLNF